VLVLLLAVLAGTAGWWYGSGRYTTTPGVINLTAAEARERLEAVGLGYDEGRAVYSETVAAGSVVRTDPAGGERVLDGSDVTVVLSRGPERYQVPALRGMTEQRARTELEENNLEVGDVVRRYNERVDEGVVLRSDPKPFTELRPGTTVDLVVSRGPKPIEVKDFTGKDADKAQAWFADRGLRVRISEEHHDDVKEGRVITQSPADGELYRGDVVALTVSKGPVLVEVPNLRAVGVEAATEELERLGFKVRTEESGTYLGLGYVSSADPDFGSMVPKGSTITLYLV
jgi:serine/threonine-protein kinase